MPEQLRVATWNLDHASNSKRPVDLQVKRILDFKPDILVLTETCKKVDLVPHGYACISCEPNEYGKFYSAIYLGPRASLSRRLNTHDDTTACCAHIRTPLGEMLIYGTIIAYHGYKAPPAWAEHYKAIGEHGNDWARLLDDTEGKLPLIVAGDFNQTRDGSSRTYGTKKGRELLSAELERNHLTCLTEENFGTTGKLTPDPANGWTRNNIDHICMSKGNLRLAQAGAWDHFTGPKQYLSDHNGVYVDIAAHSAEKAPA